MLVVWSSQGDQCLGCIISRWANKMNRKREKKCIRSDQPAWNPGGASATPQSRKSSCFFDSAVALCTMQNALLVISNLTWLGVVEKCKVNYWWLVTWLDLKEGRSKASHGSDRKFLTVLVEVQWARRAQAPIPQIIVPNFKENQILATRKEEGFVFSTKETAARNNG
jgi:hypothetical protein